MKIFNIIICSIALVLLGYYLGVKNNKITNEAISSKTSKIDVIKNPDNNEKKEKFLKETINKEHYISFKVKIIGASMDKEYVDKSLIEIKEMFASFTQLSKFELLKEEVFKVKIGKTHKISLPNYNIIYFSPKNIDNNNSLLLNIRIPWVLNVNLNVKSKEGFYQGGLKTKSGDDFIILYIEPIF